MARAATTDRPRARYVVPARNRLVVAALTALPTAAADATKRRIMGLTRAGHQDREGRPSSPGSDPP